MQKATVGLLASAIMSHQVQAAWWSPHQMKGYCSRFLRVNSRPSPSIQIENRAIYNKTSLKATRAKFIYEPTPLVDVIDTGHTDLIAWLDSYTRNSVEVLLDNSLPDWRRDKYWYFQTAFNTELFSPTSEKPIPFKPNTFILMWRQFAVGKIIMAQPNPELELYE